jgi:hypothetical protein
MWEWSWLSQHTPGAAFDDWGRVVREATSLGFDTIRFDPVPDLVLAARDAGGKLRIVANDVAVPWLSVPEESVVDPLAAVVEFAATAAAEGLGLIVSSWGLNRVAGDGVVDFSTYPAFNPIADDDAAVARYLDGWALVLDALLDAGLAEHITYVDFCNELDLVLALSSSRLRGWGAAHGEAFRATAERMIRWCHEHYPQLPATVSCCGPIDVVGAWYPRNADVLEWHSWYSEPDRPAWSERVAELFGDRVPAADDFQTPAKRARVDAVYRRAHAAADGVLRRQQDNYLAAIKACADARGLPAYLGEGYATPFWSDEPELSWDWIRSVSADAVRTVQRLGFDGYTTSNFSEPSFPLWGDEQWHRDLLTPAG